MTDDHRITDAILKGLIEHNDSGRYFGSLGAHKYYLDEATKEGFLDSSGSVTQKGKDWYAKYKLSDLSESRWMFWTQRVKGISFDEFF